MNEHTTKEAQENCVFCKILSGEYACSEIYRDNNVAAFLDIHPVNSGHVLIVPIKHASCLENLNPTIGGHMFNLAQKVASAIRKTNIKCEGVNLFLADGAAAGQEVFHTHLHVIPRFSEDGFGFSYPKNYPQNHPREELDSTAAAIKTFM